MKSWLKINLFALMIVFGFFPAQIQSDQQPVDFLIEELQSDHVPARAEAAKALGKLGTKAKAAVPALIEALENNKEVGKRGVMTEAVKALGSIGSPEAGPALVKLINNKLPSDECDRNFVNAVVNSLKKIGPAVYPAIIEGLNSEGGGFLSRNLNLAEFDESFVSVLLEELKDPNPRARCTAVYTLGEIKKRKKDVIPALIPLLKRDPDEYVRLWTIKAIGSIGSDAHPAVPVLLQILKDEKRKPLVRLSAAEAIKKIGFEDDETIAELTNTLGDKYEKIRRFIHSTLIEVGAPAAPALREAIKSAEIVPPPGPKENGPVPGDFEIRNQQDRELVRVILAADILSKIPDQQSAPLIVEGLRDTQLYHGCYVRAYVEGLAESSARLRAIDGLDLIIDWMLEAADKRWMGKKHWFGPRYERLRSCVVKYGEQAVPILRKHKPANDTQRFIVRKLVLELSGQETKEYEILRLREKIWKSHKVDDIMQLHRLTGEDVLPLLEKHRIRLVVYRNFYMSGSRFQERRKWIEAFGELKDPRAVDILLDVINGNLRDVTLGPQTEENQDVIDRFKPYWANLALIMLYRIGGNEALQALQELAQSGEYAVQAESWLLGMKGKVDRLNRMLWDSNTAVSESAALVLSELGDKRCVTELLRAAARRYGLIHLFWLKRAMKFQDDLFSAAERLQNSANLPERVLGRYLQIELSDPNLIEQFHDDFKQAGEVTQIHAFRILDVKYAGEDLAFLSRYEAYQKALKGMMSKMPNKYEGHRKRWLLTDYIPLIESTCIFGLPGPYFELDVDIAAFALACFKQPQPQIQMEALLELLKDKDQRLRIYALATLSRMGPKAKKAVPSIISALKEERWIRYHAISALGEIGPSAQEALPRLLELTKEKGGREMREIAEWAIKQIQP